MLFWVLILFFLPNPLFFQKSSFFFSPKILFFFPSKNPLFSSKNLIFSKNPIFFSKNPIFSPNILFFLQKSSFFECSILLKVLMGWHLCSQPAQDTVLPPPGQATTGCDTGSWCSPRLPSFAPGNYQVSLPLEVPRLRKSNRSTLCTPQKLFHRGI